MTAKEYLSQLITMDNAINRKQQRLMTLRDVAMNTTPNYSGETVQHTRNKNPLENIMTKIIDIDRDIDRDIDELVDFKAEVWESLIKSQMKDINGFCGLDMPTVKRGDILRWNLILQYGIFIKCT